MGRFMLSNSFSSSFMTGLYLFSGFLIIAWTAHRAISCNASLGRVQVHTETLSPTHCLTQESVTTSVKWNTYGWPMSADSGSWVSHTHSSLSSSFNFPFISFLASLLLVGLSLAGEWLRRGLYSLPSLHSEQLSRSLSKQSLQVGASCWANLWLWSSSLLYHRSCLAFCPGKGREVSHNNPPHLSLRHILAAYRN